MSFNYIAASVAVVNHERKSGRMESTYDALAAFANLTPDTESERMTEVARAIVVDGANNDGTATGKTVTADMLTGRDPGADASHRAYWKAARAVRIGLVNAVKRANPSESEDKTVDYLAAVLKAVDNGVNHELNAADILKAVQSHVDALLS